MLTPTAVSEAAKNIAGIANRTPVMTSRTLNEITGREIYLKCENYQRVGAFKFRGAYNAVSQLSDEQKAVGVVTHSSGNHAQGLALAAKLQGVKATIVMPDNAPPVKKRLPQDMVPRLSPVLRLIGSVFLRNSLINTDTQ